MKKHQHKHKSKSTVRMGFDIQGWLFNEEADLLQKFAREQQDKFGSDLLEIGSWKGRSSVVIASVLKEDHRLWIVDHFRGSPEHQKGRKFYTKPRYTRKGRPWVYPDLIENIMRFEVQDKVIILPLDSEQAAKVIDEKFCFIFIDGEHENISRDWELWFPHLIIEGICLFHDCQYEPIKKFLGELRKRSDLKVESQIQTTLAFRRLS